MIFYSHYKKIRREHKISLEDISRRTKIDVKYIKALESGKFIEIPSVYLRLFFKAYIKEIGCDVDEAIDSLDDFLNKKEDGRIIDPQYKPEKRDIFNIQLSDIQRSNVLIGFIFIIVLVAIITLQNRPTSSVFDKEESLRLDQNDLESLYEIDSEESFAEDLKFPVTIRFESSDENYIYFSDDNAEQEYFICDICDQVKSDVINEKWDGGSKTIIIGNTNDIQLILYSKSQFGSPVDLSTLVENNFPVVVNLKSDPTIVSVMKYIPSR
ncbi:MAG: helix-turn-helix domain-containing protein [Candidatus Neomarinimicrobiota bacterium]|nr:helix-turn-helix domain-containing protein [Candidatus Neomarinimicrobiota bacterium]